MSTRTETVAVDHPLFRVDVRPCPGNRWAVAFSGDDVVTLAGRGAGLLATLDRARAALVDSLAAGHDLHRAGPEIGCPRCEHEQADPTAHKAGTGR